MNHRRLISFMTCFVVALVPGLSFSSAAGNEPGTNTEAERHYEKAYELRKATDYDAAIAEYQKVIRLSPNSKIAQDAQYWIGQSYFESKQFDAALSAFQSLLDTYPASSIAPSTKQMIERVQQAKKNRALFEAVKKADVEQIRSLIAGGADVDAKWGDTHTTEKENIADDTPLCYAVDSNNMDLVKLLVEAGADVNAGRYWPSLCQALHKRNTAIAEYLIDHGANVNYPKDWGPLQEASTFTSNNIEMIKLLIARGADINGGHWPALHTAIGYWPALHNVRKRVERRDIVELLIQRGVDVNAKDTWGYTPLYYAIHKDGSDFMNILIANGAEVNTKYPEGETPLQSATKTGRTEAVKLLLEAGANINTKNDRGQTALHVIMDIRSSDNRNYRLSKKDTVGLLLTKGADVNLKDKDGRTPLHLAAKSADGDIVEFLLGKGADINAKDKQGHTPLYVAVNHDYKVAELLMNKGADSGIRAESGQTLLELAQQRKQTESTVPDLIFDGEPNNHFGSKIACGDVDGDGYDDILISAGRYNNLRGRVCLFYGGPDMNTTADLVLDGQNEGDFFGNGIACGDIDNDGYEDIVIAASYFSENRGRAYLYWGSDRNSMDAKPDKIFDGEAEKGAEFGACYPAVYDIDNDGYDDIILGASHSINKTGQAGRAYLYFGNTKESMDTSYDLIFKPENPEYSFGYTIGCGDFDNDGFGDIVIGGWVRPGRAYLYYGGSKSNMDAKADVVFKAQSEGSDYFGTGIVCVDQNRDGYDDVVIGAPSYNDWQGRTHLFHGNSKRNLDADPDMIFDGEVESSNYGFREVCGDIDGDKVNDIVIGAHFYRQRVGRVYVYWGNELAAPDPKPGRILTGEGPGDEFGFGLSCGDVNNDGFDDLVIGAFGYKAGANQGRAYLYYGGPEK